MVIFFHDFSQKKKGMQTALAKITNYKKAIKGNLKRVNPSQKLRITLILVEYSFYFSLVEDKFV